MSRLHLALQIAPQTERFLSTTLYLTRKARIMFAIGMAAEILSNSNPYNVRTAYLSSHGRKEATWQVEQLKAWFSELTFGERKRETDVKEVCAESLLLLDLEISVLVET